jgi:AI-2E family transporter
VAIAKLKLLASRRAADPPLAAAPAATAAADEDDLILPSDIKAVFLGGLFVLAMLAACYVAAEIVLPIVLAFVLSLVLQPAMRVLERIRLPRGIAAILLIFLLFGTLGGLGTALSGPATSWAQKLPTGIPKLEERLSFLSRPIAAFQKFAEHAQVVTLGGEPKAVPVTVQGSGLSDRLLNGTRTFASGLLETVLVLFFLLVSGDTFLRRLVEILPRFKDKRQAVDISQQIESDVSANRHGHGALRGGRSGTVGNGCLPAQLYSDPRTDDSALWSSCSLGFCRSTRCGRHFCRPGFTC